MRILLAQLLDNKPGSPFSLCCSHIVRFSKGSPVMNRRLNIDSSVLRFKMNVITSDLFALKNIPEDKSFQLCSLASSKVSLAK